MIAQTGVSAELAALIAAAPFMLGAIWWDLRQMRLPNWLTLSAALAFLAYGALFLDWSDCGWRLLGGLLVLAVSMAMFFTGRMGGGDGKLLAASALYVPAGDAAPAMMLLSFWLLSGYGAIWLLRSLLRGRATTGWAALAPGARYPMGVSIGAAMISYLALRVWVAG